MAGANISAISYYFGGKENLRMACAEHVAEKLVAATGAVSAGGADLTAAEAAQALETMVAGICRTLLQPEAGDLAQFILREILRPGVVLDVVYPRFFDPLHKSACALWARATGQDAEAETTRLAVFSVIGQVVYFRIGQPLVCKRMGWDAVGAAQVAAIETVIRGNLRAMISDASKGRVA